LNMAANHNGTDFTATTHTTLSEKTNPRNIKLPSSFVAVVTGAGKGLGYQIALAYAQAGAAGISVSSRTKSDLKKLEAEIKKVNPETVVLATVTDTTKDSDVERLALEVSKTFGRVDAVIANAGIVSRYVFDADGSNRRLPVGLLEDGDFDRVFDINLTGTARTARHFLPLLAQTKDGPQAFVIITSLASQLSDGKLVPTAYNISKLALNRLAESLHNEYYEQYGVTAFAVHPGAVLTPQTELHSNQKGDQWDQLLTDDPRLCGGWLTWLTKEKREWLSGRYLSINWDVEELEMKKEEIVRDDKLKFRMVV
jgi:NAD(P)-dependent dehydrogenase (short-subunit alcohol dehydrogenase family)